MTTAQKLALRASEIRKRLAELAGIEDQTDETRGEISTLRTEYIDVESRAQAAIVADAPAIDTRHAEGGEGNELRGIIERANVGSIFSAAVEHRQTEGAEKEIQEHYGLGPSMIPLALLERRAVTPAPGVVGTGQSPIIGAVFPDSAADFLHFDRPTVPTGESVFPVLTTSADVGTPAENAAQSETTGAFTAEALSPGRIQAAFFYSREDRSRFMGMSESLRENLASALSDKVDQQIINGAEGLLNGTNLIQPQRVSRHHVCELQRPFGLWQGLTENMRAVSKISVSSWVREPMDIPPSNSVRQTRETAPLSKT